MRSEGRERCPTKTCSGRSSPKTKLKMKKIYFDIVVLGLYNILSIFLLACWTQVCCNTPKVPRLNEFITFPRNSPTWDDTMMFCSYAGVRTCDDIKALSYNGISNYIEEVSLLSSPSCPCLPHQAYPSLKLFQPLSRILGNSQFCNFIV